MNPMTKQQQLKEDGHAYAVIKISNSFRVNLVRPNLLTFFHKDMNHRGLVGISNKKKQINSTNNSMGTGAKETRCLDR